MRTLVFVTQRLDADDPILGATVAKVRALAARVDRLVVLCDTARTEELPDNVRVRTFAAGSQAARGARLAAALAQELRRRPLGVVAHMIPLYALVAAPLVRPFGVPLVLWYTHWSDTAALRAAERVSTAVATVDVRSFPFASPKVRGIGHGIEVDPAPCAEPAPSETLRLLVLGRYSRAKGLPVILRAQRLLLDRGLPVHLAIHGPAGNADERAHLEELQRLRDELALTGSVELNGPAPHADVVHLLRWADALVSAHDSADKAVYEAAAVCRPVIVSHAGFEELVAGIEPPLLFRKDDPSALADTLAALAAGADRAAIGRLLRERVEERHSADHWAAAILSLVT
jgi:glycosyltransferase involved in cell wall biosynthesis